MKIIQATKHLRLELWPAGEVSEHPAVAIRGLAADQDDTPQMVIVHLHEIRRLIDALTEAAVELASPSIFGANGQ